MSKKSTRAFLYYPEDEQYDGVRVMLVNRDTFLKALRELTTIIECVKDNQPFVAYDMTKELKRSMSTTYNNNTRVVIEEEKW